MVPRCWGYASGTAATTASARTAGSASECRAGRRAGEPRKPYKGGGCGRVCGGEFLAAGEAVRGAVGGGDVGAGCGEGVCAGVGDGGGPARDAGVPQAEPVM